MSSYIVKNKLNFLNLFIFILLFSYFFTNTNFEDKNELNDCLTNKGIFQSEYEIKSEDIYISDEISNIFCLGKIINFYEDNKGNRTIVIGTNPRVKQILQLSSFLILGLIIFLKKNALKFFLLVGFFNIYFLHLLTNPTESFYLFLFKYKFIMFGFLLILNIKFKNIYIFFFSIYSFFFIEYQFFGIFLFLIYLINRFKYELNNVSSNILKLTPLVFLSSRFISGYVEGYYQYWSVLSPHNYLNFIRFWDIQWFLSKLNCNVSDTFNYQYRYSSQTFECPNKYSYGPLTDLIGLEIMNIWTVSLFITFITYGFLYFSYLKLTKTYENKKIILTILFLSPPMNFLLDRVNFDLIILIIVGFILFRKKDLNIWESSILLFLSGIKLHVVGAIVGLLGYSIKNRLNQLLAISISSLLGLVGLVFTVRRNFVISEISRATREDLAYGLLIDAKLISDYFSINLTFIYASLLLSIILISIFIFLKEEKNKIRIVDNELLFFTLATWFLITTLYENYYYRYPIFFILFFLMTIGANKKIKISIIGMILLSPLPVVDENIQLIILTIQRLCHYYVVIFLSSELLKMFFNSKRFNKIS